MSESETEPGGIDDQQLPEDLQPGDDNPLAEAPDPDDVPDDLDVLGGKGAEESAEESADEDADGS